MFDNTERPGIEEQYHCAGTMTDEEARGPGHLTIAAGIAARDHGRVLRYPDTPNGRIGHVLSVLKSEWHGVAQPIRQTPKSIRQWIEDLPLVRTGERVVKGKTVPIMTRDRDGARRKHEEERQGMDARYEQELKFLAQRIPARHGVRESLYVVAVHWGWADAEEIVAAVLKAWLDDKCLTCNGTGEVMVGEKVAVCPDCGGRKKAPMPYGDQGRRLEQYMDNCVSDWLGSLKKTSRQIHKRA